MMLLLDIGNTSVKWAVRESGVMSPGGCFQHQGEDFKTLAQAAWGGLQVPEKIVVSNVAGSDMGDSLADWALNYWGLTPVFVRVTDKAFGVTNAYARPTDLGVDRWAALIGAHSSNSGALCIVDCGTAITLDFLAADGVHKGGVILPGVAMLERMLLKNTADISLSNDSQFAAPFATGTSDAVHGGATYMVAAAIDRIVTDMEVAAGTRPGVIITGGDAGRIQSLLSCSTRHAPDLVLKGLAILAGGS
jgi:type III pantothenate kinase